MANQTLVFVALPNGLSAQNRLKLSIYLAPRLNDGPTLAAFKDFLNWPGQVQQGGLSFNLSCGARTAKVQVDRSALRPDLWHAIFTPATYVAPYETTSVANRLMVSYPVRDSLTYLKYLYQTVGSGRNLDSQREFLQLLEPLVFRDGDTSTLATALSQIRVEMWREQHPDPVTGGVIVKTASATTARMPPDGIPTTLSRPANAGDAMTRFALFHNMPPAPNRAPLPTAPQGFDETLDFHQALTAISSYPKLLRALGLVFDVEAPASLCPASPAAGAYGVITVKSVDAGFSWSLKPRFGLPSTAYVASPNVFAAAPATAPSSVAAGTLNAGDVASGFLALSPGSFQLMQVDVDGALLKTLSLADNAALNETDPSVVGGDLHALRTGGVALIAGGRGEQMLQAIADNNSLNEALTQGQAFPRPLTVVDLTRGYRLDIFSSRTGQWHSLHRRNGRYLLGEDQSISIVTTDEEGFVQPAVGSPADDPTRPSDPTATAAGVPQPGTDLFLHERVARWDGWSLSAPRPGQALNRSVDPGQATTPDPTMYEPVTPFKMSTRFQAFPGSLPELRFGDQYRLRARAVDLAGNSLPLSAQAPATATLPAGGALLPYMRFEPVPPPLVVLQEPAGPGGSLERLVIRSFNSDPSLDATPSPQADSRHIAPPRTSARMAELHGLLDDAHGHLRGDASLYRMIVARDAYEAPSKGGMQIAAGDTLPVLYLPDPFSRGAALRALPGAPINTYGELTGHDLDYNLLPDVQPNSDSVTFIDFGPHWPERNAFLLTLQEGLEVPAWDDSRRVLTVGLDKAAVAVVALSSYTSASDLSVMALWAWIREAFEAIEAVPANLASILSADVLALLTRLVGEGGHEMITPSRTLTLVHAVQQPLGRPDFQQLPVVHQPSNPIFASALRNDFTPITAWRSQASHAAVLLGGLLINANSTSRIDLMGAWVEVADNLADPGPTSSIHSDHVETISLAEPDAGPIMAPGSTTRAVAVYIPITDNLWFAAPFDVLEGVDTPTTVAAPIHNFNDTKHRWVTYTATATSRYQEYFPPGLDFTRSGAPLVVDVPSSARPSPPEILYVVPAFGWERQEATNIKSAIRYGNTVRVYLSRPWFSSGDNEQLGVVLWPIAENPPDAADRETCKPYFTQWGGDPIWQTGPVNLVPTIDDFPDASAATALTLDGTPQTFDVAALPVQYDQERRIWFCDIAFKNPYAYAPFVRLALARYQSHSIQGVELSRVVLADFVQLTPDRSAVVSIDPNAPGQARVFVGGLAPTGPNAPSLNVTVEQRMPRALTDMGWEAAAPGVVTVTEDQPAPSQPGSVLWSGSVSFAATPSPGQYRIVVREFETIPIYTEPGLEAHETGQRLVYAAIINYDYPSIAHQ